MTKKPGAITEMRPPHTETCDSGSEFFILFTFSQSHLTVIQHTVRDDVYEVFSPARQTQCLDSETNQQIHCSVAAGDFTQCYTNR